MNKIHFFLVIIAILTSIRAVGQEVVGTVRTYENGTPLAGALIRTIDSKGVTISYNIADKDGAFSFIVPKEATTMIVAIIGYEEVRFSTPFDKRYDLRLKTKPEQIKESSVQARKVTMAGDTVTYNIKALTQRDDMVLGDALKRIPGIELTPTGHLKVDGKDLGKFYVNGKDLLDYNYNLATKNLNISAINKIELIRNHQAIKVLEGLEDSDKAAVNIILNDSYKGKINWRETGSAGVATEEPYLPLAMDLSAIYLSGERASIMTGSYDSQGKALKENTTDFQQIADGNRKNVRQHLATSPVSAPLENKRSLFNKSLDSRAVNTASLSSTSAIYYVISYSCDNRNSESRNSYHYHRLNKDALILDRLEKRKETGQKLTGSITYRNNTPKHFISDRLFADIGKSSGSSDITGDLTKMQKTANRRLDIDNDFQVKLKTTSGKALNISSYSQITNLNERLVLNVDEARQTVGGTSIFEDLSIRGISNSWKYCVWSLEPKLNWTLYKRNNSLTGISDDVVPGLKSDVSSVSHITSGLDGDLLWKRKAFLATLKGSLHYDRIKFRKYQTGKIIPEVSYTIMYRTGQWEVSFDGGIKTLRPDIMGFSSSLILTDYYSMTKGKDAAVFLPYSFASGYIIFRKPVDGWHLKISATYNNNERPLQGREILKDYIIGYDTNTSIINKSVKSRAELTKALFAINGKVSGFLMCSALSSAYQQDNVVFKYMSKFLAPGFDISTSPTRFWNITAEGIYSIYQMVTEGINSSGTQNLHSWITNTLYPTDRVSFGSTTDLYYNSSIRKLIVFQDLFMTWTRPKGMRIKLQINNLLNHRTYSYSSLSPLLKSTYSYNIRPLTILIGLDWTL